MFSDPQQRQGTLKCMDDATKAGYPFYSEYFFCNQNDELQLYDWKSEAGLCPNFHRYGTKAWDKLVECITLFIRKLGNSMNTSGMVAIFPFLGPNQWLH
jgi:hypothetical protein